MARSRRARPTAPACAMPATRWEARLDGAPAPSLTELCAQIAVVTFEPGSHDLIGGGAEHRRRFLDWGLFHVEPEFLPLWRRYARALKQRNAAAEVRARRRRRWRPGSGSWPRRAKSITRHAPGLPGRLEPFAGRRGARTSCAELGAATLEFRPGWKRAGAAAGRRPAAEPRARPRQRPHRGRARIAPTGGSASPACRAARRCRAARKSWPRWPASSARRPASPPSGRAGRWCAWTTWLPSSIAAHQRQVLQSVLDSGAQVLLTGTAAAGGAGGAGLSPPTFHVEHGVHVEPERVRFHAPHGSSHRQSPGKAAGRAAERCPTGRAGSAAARSARAIIGTPYCYLRDCSRGSRAQPVPRTPE